MIKLNFPFYEFHLAEKDGKPVIFDPVRKKYVALTPEEWVRQHVIQYLVNQKRVPLSLIRAEAWIRLFKTRKRFDVLVSDRNGYALLVVECKAPSVRISGDVLDQAVRYNMALEVTFLMLTNGLQHIFFKKDKISGKMEIIDNIPDFQDFG
jgi:hypothetical protein